MSLEVLAHLLCALSINELIHNGFEIWGAQQKVEWLTTRMDGRPHSDWPINIDNRIKVYVLHFLLLIMGAGGSFLVLHYGNVTVQQALSTGIVVLLLNYLLTTHYMDTYHIKIGKLLKRFPRKKT